MKSVEEIKKEIEERNIEIEKKLNTPNDRLQFYESFLRNNKFDHLRKIAEINFSDLLLAYLGAYYKEEDFSYLEKKVNSVREFVDNSTSQHFETLFRAIAVHVETYPFNGDFEEHKDILISSIKKRTPHVECSHQKASDIVNIALLFVKYLDGMKNIMDSIITFKIVKEEINHINFSKKRIEKNFDYYEEKLLKVFLDDIDYKKEVAFISNYVMTLKELFKTERKKYIRELNDNKAFVDLFESELKKPLITNYRKIIGFLQNEELKKNCLKLINDHNVIEYQKVDKEYNLLCNDAKIQYNILLSEYGIHNNEYDLDCIMKNSYYDLKKILQILNKRDMSNQKKVKILENTSLSVVESIDKYVMDGVLANDFVEKNYEVFLSNSPKNNVLQKNIQLLIEKNINPAIFIQSQNILLKDSTLVKNNLKALEDYDYLKSIKGIQQYDFLEKDNLPILLDKYIELGLENMLENHIDLLNEDKVDRLVLLKQLNLLDNNNYRKVKEILQTSFDIVPDNQLSDYLYRNTNLDKELYNFDYSMDLELLKKFEISSRAYQINGNILSKNRVKRNYQKLSSKGNSIQKSLLLYSIYEGQPDKIKMKKV